MHKSNSKQFILADTITNNDNTVARKVYSDDNFKNIFDRSPFGNLTLSRELVILRANQAFVSLLGFNSINEIIGTNILKYTQKKSRPDWLLLQQSLWLLQLSSYMLETCLLDINGNCIQCNVTSMLYQEHSIELGYIIIEDISKRRAAEEQKRKSEANLLTILNHTDSGYVLYNADLMIISYNSVAESLSELLYGKSLKQGSYLLDYFPKERHPAILHITKRAIEGENIAYERYFNTAEGERWLEVKWINVNTDHKNWGFILTSKDITDIKLAAIERERKDLELIQRNKVLEQFTQITSHNLRAPVANIIGLAELVSEMDLDADEQKSLMDNILLSARKLDMVINDINDILHAQDRFNQTKEKINLQNLVDDIKVSISRMITEQDAIIKCDFAMVPNLVSIRSYLYSIFYNMILNSLKYRKEIVNPQIILSSTVTKNKIELHFKDNGKGIDLNENGDKLFGLYKRFDTSVAGRGLGLYMVKTQIETLGGTIEVKSELGNGAEFIVRFPI